MTDRRKILIISTSLFLFASNKTMQQENIPVACSEILTKYSVEIAVGAYGVALCLYSYCSPKKRAERATLELLEILDYSRPADPKNSAALRSALERGADVHVYGNDGESALNFAIESNDKALVEYIVGLGARFYAEDQDCVMQKALEHNQNSTDIIKILLDNGYPIEGFDQETSIHGGLIEQALEENALLAAQFFLKHGADINQVGIQADTALHYCKTIDGVKFLLENGANFDLKNQFGTLPEDTGVLYLKPVKKALITQKKQHILSRHHARQRALIHEVGYFKEFGIASLIDDYAEADQDNLFKIQQELENHTTN
jgi:ankyrin repeat protein